MGNVNIIKQSNPFDESHDHRHGLLSREVSTVKRECECKMKNENKIVNGINKKERKASGKQKEWKMYAKEKNRDAPDVPTAIKLKRER